MKKPSFIRNKCQCGHTNLVPYQKQDYIMQTSLLTAPIPTTKQPQNNLTKILSTYKKPNTPLLDEAIPVSLSHHTRLFDSYRRPELQVVCVRVSA